MFKLLAGPCAIENEELVIQVAKVVKEITDELGIDYYFKASFDKSNRTSIHSFRGPVLEEGMRILKKLKIHLVLRCLQIFMKHIKLKLLQKWMI